MGDASNQESDPVKADENAWYLLATLFGEQTKNRHAWNRYFVANLCEETRLRLIEEKRQTEEELTPFSPVELKDVEIALAERCRHLVRKPILPKCDSGIHFDGVQFDKPVNFAGYLFTDCSFKDATFSPEADAIFRNATFCGWISFENATFNGQANFIDASFPRETIAFTTDTNFAGAKFCGDANFMGAFFSGTAWFKGAAFSRGAIFCWVNFAQGAFFGRAMFSGWADFERTTFAGKVDFAAAIFAHDVNFAGAAFSYGAEFVSATFGKSSSFVNVELKGETSFEGAMFKTEPPKFFGAKLHQGTVWRSIIWPPTPKDEKEAGTFIDAYACLKLEMDRLKKHEDELNFFARELQSRRVLLGRWGWGLPIWLYGVLSDYGRSYLRPLGALFYLALIGTLAFLSSDSLSPGQALGLSFANSLNVFGFRKDFFDPTVIAHLPAWFDVISAVQTIFGTILLFLFGLGIRNKFRMK
jgi:uncharacterized protein YjbI with pentapeptide repeats